MRDLHYAKMHKGSVVHVGRGRQEKEESTFIVKMPVHFCFFEDTVAPERIKVVKGAILPWPHIQLPCTPSPANSSKKFWVSKKKGKRVCCQTQANKKIGCSSLPMTPALPLLLLGSCSCSGLTPLSV